MTTERVTEAVSIACMGFKRNERIAYQRYFLKYFFPCYSHVRIAKMTDDCDHSTVQKVIKRLGGAEYDVIRERVLSRVIIGLKKPVYTWIKRQ